MLPDIGACLLAHIGTLTVGIIVSSYYLVGAFTHKIRQTLINGRICSLLCFVFAVVVRYFQWSENVLWFALARAAELSMVFAAVIYVCEHVAENIFMTLRCTFPQFVNRMLAALRVLLALAVVAPSVELAVLQTNRALHAQTIINLSAQLVGSAILCITFVYLAHLVFKFRRWRIESGMDNLHAHAKELFRKQYETALVMTFAGIYSAALVWTLMVVIENPRGALDAEASIARCPSESYATIWAPLAIVIGSEITTHDWSAERRRSDKRRDEAARTRIARPLPSPNSRGRRLSIECESI